MLAVDRVGERLAEVDVAVELANGLAARVGFAPAIGRRGSTWSE